MTLKLKTEWKNLGLLFVLFFNGPDGPKEKSYDPKPNKMA